MINLIVCFAGAMITGLCIMAFAAMGRSTRHCFRFVYGLIAVPATALMILPFAQQYEHLRSYFYVTLVCAFMLYMLLDRRRISPQGDKHGV